LVANPLGVAWSSTCYALTAPNPPVVTARGVQPGTAGATITSVVIVYTPFNFATQKTVLSGSGGLYSGAIVKSPWSWFNPGARVTKPLPWYLDVKDSAGGHAEIYPSASYAITESGC